jgi:hypothetical protein
VLGAGDEHAHGVAGRRHPGRPQHRAESLPAQEEAGRYADGSGGRPDHGAQHRHEPRDDQGSANAEAVRQPLGEVEGRGQVGAAGTGAEPAAGAAAEQIAELGAEHRSG